MAYSKEIRTHIKEHGLDDILGFQDKIKPVGINDTVNPSVTEPYQTEWDDLVRLHKLVLDRKVTTVLEFGVGKSTPVFAHALAINKARHGDFIRNNLRRNNPFEVHSIDDDERYIKITKRLIPKHLSTFCNFHYSPVVMGTFNDRICTYYKKLPNICPDMIYLDAPSQAGAIGDVRGISTNHPDRLPMAADILAFEHFLLPGTLIVVDGRTANARFLKCNLQRAWTYKHDETGDVHLFELRERPLGKYNKAQIKFCLEQTARPKRSNSPHMRKR